MPYSFQKGTVDAVPIFIGYVSVGFAFGICAVSYGHPMWSPVLMSLSQMSGTGQFAIIDLLRTGSSFGTIVATVLVFNLRYVLMALAVAQRLPEKVGFWKRALIAMGDTDEIVGVAINQGTAPRFMYLMGLTVVSVSGWNIGTILGSNPFTSSILPADLVKSFNLALYAMFVAIILPEARSRKPVLLCVVLAGLMSISMRLMPCKMDTGWVTLIAGIASSVIAALLFPKKYTGTNK